MNNKGQISVFLSLMICVFVALTFTAFEVTRLYTGKIKIRSCVHSVQTSIMADYDRELFEQYDLLFLDTTYGTGNDAYLEEKITDYMDVSLNGDANIMKSEGEYEVEDICVIEKVGIFDDNMKLLKEEIVEYEKSAAMYNYAEQLKAIVEGSSKNIDDACEETQTKAQKTVETEGGVENNMESDEGVKDPRKTLSAMLQGGILNLVMPGNTLSTQVYNLDSATNEYEKENVTDFQDIDAFRSQLTTCADDGKYTGLQEESAFLNYVRNHFSNGVHTWDDRVMKCEVEYILQGKDNDCANMEAVASDLLWMRMAVNYSYILSDTSKKAEAEAMAVAICTATGIPEFEKVVQYLLLGCWAYAESIYEVKDLLDGGRVPFIKTSDNWRTDLESLTMNGSKKEDTGLSYEDYLMLMLAAKCGTKTDKLYCRMLDLIELNLQQTNPGFQIENCVGLLELQGTISMEPLFLASGKKDIYIEAFHDKISYGED